MKKIKIILAVAALCAATHQADASWFGNDTKRLERERELQHQVQLETTRANRWQMTSFFLGTGSVVILIVGTAIGSKGKRAVKESVIHEPRIPA